MAALRKFQTSPDRPRYHRGMQQTIETLRARVHAAAAAGEVLRLVGSGSKDFLGQPLQGTALSTAGLQGVVAYEPTELVITVGAATPWREVVGLVAQQRQCMAFDPPVTGPDMTVGGVIAAGLSGPARASVGGVRDFILGAQMINGRGELLNFGGQVMKNVAGYDLSRVLAGSMGTLGIITQASIKVLPQALAEATLCFLGSQEHALAQLMRWRAQPLPIDASCWVLNAAGDGVLALRLRGAAVAIEAARESMLAQAGSGHLAFDEPGTMDWDALRDQRHAFFTQAPSEDACLWRLGVPAATPAMPLGLPRMMEWHGAQRWFWGSAHEAHGLRDWAKRVGGHATLYRVSAAHGEADKAVGVYSPLSPVLQTVNTRLQAQFDPQGVFRTQRLG